MLTFLICWAIAFGSLAVTLGLLSLFYRLRDADLGLGGFRREVVIATITSLLQAGALWASMALMSKIHGRMLTIVGIVTWLTYRVTHATTSLFEGTSGMDDWQAGAVAVTQVGLLICASIVLNILGNS